MWRGEMVSQGPGRESGVGGVRSLLIFLGQQGVKGREVVGWARVALSGLANTFSC